MNFKQPLNCPTIAIWLINFYRYVKSVHIFLLYVIHLPYLLSTNYSWKIAAWKYLVITVSCVNFVTYCKLVCLPFLACGFSYNCISLTRVIVSTINFTYLTFEISFTLWKFRRVRSDSIIYFIIALATVLNTRLSFLWDNRVLFFIILLMVSR